MEQTFTTTTTKLTVKVENDQITTSQSSQISDEELQAIRRNDFVQKILDWVLTKHIDEGQTPDGVFHSRTIGGKRAKFLVVKNHHNLVECYEGSLGTYHFEIAGKLYYSYKLSDLVSFLEDAYDAGKVTALNNEVQF